MNIGSSFYTSSLQQQFSRLQDAQARAQAKLATGRTFREASENPDASLAAQRISLDRLGLDGDQGRRNLAARLNESSVLNAEQASALLKQAMVKMEEAHGHDYDDVENAGLGLEIDGYIEQAVAHLNDESEGRFLFGGNQTDVAPFQLVREDPEDPRSAIVGVNYVGSTEPLEFDIGLDVRMDPTANALLNESWAQLVGNLVEAKNRFLSGDSTGSQQAIDDAKGAEDRTHASTIDLIGKSLRIDTLNEWAAKADKNLANQEASLQEADINEVILQFNELQRSYEASLQSGRLLLGLSLVDFL